MRSASKMYRWCCYQGRLKSPKLMMILADLKFGDRDITESCLVFLYPKDGEASGEPQLSSSTKLYLKLYKLI